MIISFSGNDGVGKTSLAELTRGLLLQNGIENRVNKEFDFLLVKLGKCICGKSRFENYNRVFMSHDGQATCSCGLRLLVRVLYPMTIFVHFLILYVKYELLFSRRVLICDRYIYDYRFTLKRQQIHSKILDTLFLRFPKPKVAFVIDLSPRMILERQRKSRDFYYRFEFYQFLSSEYHALAISKSIELIENLDLDQSFGTVRQTLSQVFGEYGIGLCT